MTRTLSALASPWAKLLLLTLGLLGLAEPALAQNIMQAPGGASVWTVYAFGNAQAVSDTFRALANFTASSTFQTIVSLIAICGVLAVGLTSGFSSAVAKNLIGYIVAVFLVCYIFFGVGSNGPLVVRVEVYDSVDGTWKAPVTVPAVVGIPASLISNAGMEITRQIEASFPLPEELKISNGAPFNLAAALLNDATKARITDPNLASSFAYYVQDCFTIAVANGQLPAATILNSTNFLTDLDTNLTSVYVNTQLGNPVGTPKVVSCDEGWSYIYSAIQAQGGGAADFLQNASAWASTPALSVVNSAADTVAQWATNNGVTNGGAMVKQAAVLSTFSGSFRQAAAATGNSDFLTGLAVEQAHQTQVAGWVVGAEVFNRVMGYVFAILQVFIYGITPLILAVSLVPGLGLALIKNFGQILLWLAIWQPMLGIVNFIVLSMQQTDLGGALNTGLGEQGFTMTNMSVISEKTSNMRAAAVFVGTMVPALAWAMVKGSVDFSRIIGAASGEKFAAGAANTMATGNYSLNQASMDSFTSNKHSVGTTGDFGAGYTSTGQFGVNKKNDMGGSQNVAHGAGVGLSSSASRQLTDGTTGADANAKVGSVSESASGSRTTNFGDVSSVNNSTSDTTSSGTGTAITAAVAGSAGGSVSVGYSPGGQPAAMAGSGTGSGAGSGNGQQGTPDTSNMTVGKDSNVRTNISGQLGTNGTVTAMGNANTAHQNQASEALSRQRSGGSGGSTSKGHTDNQMVSDGRTVTGASGEQRALTDQVTAIPNASARADVNRALSQPLSNIYADRYGPPPTPTGAAALVKEVSGPGGVAAKADERHDALKAEQAGLKDEYKAERKEAAQERRELEAKSKDVPAEVARETPDAKAEANKSAATRAAEAIKRADVVPDAVADKAIEFAKKFDNKPSTPDTSKPVTEAPSGQQPPKGDDKPKAETPLKSEPAQSSPKPAGDGPTTMSFDRMTQGHRAGQQPDGGRDAEARPQNSQAAAQPNGKPDRDEREQGREAPGNAILAAQMMPPPPPAPPAPQQDTQAAQQPPAPPPPPAPAVEPAPPAPQPQQPLPFERDPNANGNAAQMETRANLAEQQTTQLQNQMRNANGILDSAEGRPAEELPRVIHEAQDNLRPR